MVDSSPVQVRGYVPLTPVPLPQDQLSVPSFPLLLGSNSGRESIDPFNRFITKQEFFCYSSSISNIGWGEQQQIIIPTDPDGDFWMMTFMVCTYLSGTSQQVTNNICYFNIKDARTGNSMFNANGALQGPVAIGPNTSLFTKFIPVITGTGTEILAKNPMTQPVCLTRDGAIVLNFNMQAKAIARQGFDIFFSLQGWKEYAKAAT